MLKRILIFFSFVCSVIYLQAKPLVVPYWITNPPLSESNTFYYRVTSAEGADRDAAYARAFAKAILESSWKIGVKVEKTDMNLLEKDIERSINLVSPNMTLPLNKVCEYVEDVHTSSKVRIYILWQVAQYGNIEPNFEDFNKCE